MECWQLRVGCYGHSSTDEKQKLIHSCDNVQSKRCGGVAPRLMIVDNYIYQILANFLSFQEVNLCSISRIILADEKH